MLSFGHHRSHSPSMRGLSGRDSRLGSAHRCRTNTISRPSVPLSDASHGSQAFPSTTIPGMPAIGPIRRLAPMREDHRIDDLAAIDTAPSFEPSTTCVVPKVNEGIPYHVPSATLTAHHHPPSAGFLCGCPTSDRGSLRRSPTHGPVQPLCGSFEWLLSSHPRPFPARHPRIPRYDDGF